MYLPSHAVHIDLLPAVACQICTPWLRASPRNAQNRVWTHHSCRPALGVRKWHRSTSAARPAEPMLRLRQPVPWPAILIAAPPPPKKKTYPNALLSTRGRTFEINHQAIVTPTTAHCR